jgi:Dpy-30 motif
MAINDDYAFWHSRHDMAEGGKLFLIDRMDYNTHPIFFDDNALVDDPKIIFPVDLVDGKQISWNRLNNRYIVKVEPERAIIELDYFIKCIELCEKNRADEIYRREHNLPEEGENKIIPENKWAKLQALPIDDYLSNTVMPLLSQGLKYVETVRPTDPVATLAFYLLKHKKDIDIPKKPIEEKKIEAPKDDKKEEAKKENEDQPAVDDKPKEKAKEEKKAEKGKDEKKHEKEEKKAEKQKEVKKAEKAK